MLAQAAHASMGVITRMFNYEATASGNIHVHFYTRSSNALWQWLNNSFTKIAVYCNSEEELLDLKQQADDAGLINCLIKDNGKTEFHGIPTHTALAIGPAYVNEIDKITGHLKLL